MAGFNVKLPPVGGSSDDDGEGEKKASLSIPKQKSGSGESNGTTINAEKASSGSSNTYENGSSGSVTPGDSSGGGAARRRGIVIPGRGGDVRSDGLESKSSPGEDETAASKGNGEAGERASSRVSNGPQDGSGEADGGKNAAPAKPAGPPKMPVLVKPGALGGRISGENGGENSSSSSVNPPMKNDSSAERGDSSPARSNAGEGEDGALENDKPALEPVVGESLAIGESSVDDEGVDHFLDEVEAESLDFEPLDGPVNPLLSDDGESETYAVGGGDLLRDVDEGTFNPLLDDEEDEDLIAFTGRERGPAPEQVVPERPDRDAVQEANRAKKLAAEEDTRRRREAARVGRATTEDDAIDFKRRAVAEVSLGDVEASGKAARAAREGKKAGVAPAEGSVKTPRGADRWAVKAVDGAPEGKLGREELSLFANLSLANSDDDARDELRAIFARVDEKHDDEEAREKRRELAKRAILGDEAMARGTRKQFTEKDRDVLRFLAKFKYANAKHVSRTLQVSEKTMEKRLHSLRKRGLMVQKALYGAKPLWCLTEAGMICSGLDLPRTKESGITYGMLPHGFVVNHVAGNLWAGGINVLNLEDYPVRNRLREKGELAMGEELVSELEIQSSFSQIRIGSSKESYRPLISESRDRLFKEWKKAGGPDFGPSPEQVPGNEFMWTLIPPFNLNLAYHVPDLVVKRPRKPDGSPDSIAVEIELANKPYALYERALYAYKYDSLIYGQVIWVVKSRGAARKLEQAADKLGLLDEGRIDIVPIYTEEGIFTGKAEWTI